MGKWLSSAVAAAAVVSAGCGLLGHGRTGPEGDARNRDLTMHVINENFYDATIYAVSSGYRKRLGVVGGNKEDTFTFRWAPQELRVEIKLLAVGSTTTYSLPVDEGDVLELRVQPDLHRRIPPAGLGQD